MIPQAIPRGRLGQVHNDAEIEAIGVLRAQGLSWPDVARRLGWSPRMMRKRQAAYADRTRLEIANPPRCVQEREEAMLARVRADGGYPRAETINGRTVWIYPFERRAA